LNRSRNSNPYSLHIHIIDLNSGQQQVLIQQPEQSSGHMSLAPDGTQLLFDEIQVAEQPRNSILRDTVGQAIAKSSLWIFPLKAENRPNLTNISAQKLSNLSLSGLQPSWLP
jgi:hypothetical protein